jgi:hypothetical protein
MLAPYAPQYAVLNTARNSLQVKSCNGAVIANLRMSEADWASARRITRVTSGPELAAVGRRSPFNIMTPPFDLASLSRG